MIAHAIIIVNESVNIVTNSTTCIIVIITANHALRLAHEATARTPTYVPRTQLVRNSDDPEGEAPGPPSTTLVHRERAGHGHSSGHFLRCQRSVRHCARVGTRSPLL